MFDICSHKLLFSKEKIQYLALYCVHFPIYLFRALHLKYRFSSEGGTYSLKMVIPLDPLTRNCQFVEKYQSISSLFHIPVPTLLLLKEKNYQKNNSQIAL